MKSAISMMSLVIALPLALFCSGPLAGAAEQALDTDSKKLSYAIGMDVGKSIRQLGPNARVDLAVVLRGIEDTLKGKPLLTRQEADNAKVTYFRQLRTQASEQAQSQVEQIRAEGEAFLAKNKTRKGVYTTASGLQYEVLRLGKGPRPQDTDAVTVHYRGTLLDGTEFDSSYQRSEPATFALKGVIPGWTEALQLMPVGSKFRLFIPPALAYGAQGAGGKIGPYATLIFDVELLSIASR